MAGKRSEIGLGPLHTLSLAVAREKAQACRRLVGGVDPIAARDDARTSQALSAAFTHSEERPPTLIGAGKSPFLIEAYTLLLDFPQIDNTSFSLMKHNSDDEC